MTIAVFFYVVKNNFRPEDGKWLQSQLEAMATEKGDCRFLVFSNIPDIIKPAHTAISIAQWKAPKLVLVRQRTLQLWSRKAKAAGAEAVICVGLSSMTNTGLPTFALLPAGVKLSPNALQKWQSKGSHFWVTSERDKAAAEQAGGRFVTVVAGGPMLPTITGEEAADLVKDRYTEGCEYFLYAGPLAPTPVLIGLLKAFSRFKHRQKSSWKLVLLPAVSESSEVGELQKALATYKYRSEVVLPGPGVDETQMAAIFTAAYAFVQPAVAGPYGLFLKDAISFGLPVVAASEAFNKELGGNAALYYEGSDEQLLAECLMRVYKDEALRGRLADAAKALAVQAGWSQSAAIAWQSMGR